MRNGALRNLRGRLGLAISNMISVFRVLLVACSFVTTTIGLPRRNVTVTVPDGFSNHSKDDLFCLPNTWSQILIFYAVNYGAYAATIRSRPGQIYYYTARDIIFALLLPFSGVMRAIESFARCSWPIENDFVKAACAGALCVVVRNLEWESTRKSRTVEEPSKQKPAGATSIENLQSGDRLQTQFEEKNDESSADRIEAYEDVHEGQIAKDTDPSPRRPFEDIELTPIETASEGHE